MGSLRRAIFSTIPRIISFNQSPLATPQSLHRPILGSFTRFYSEGSTQSLGFDLSDEESKRRLFNRLLYRSKQRGYLELDLVLGNWVEAHIHSLDENGIKSLVHVLDLIHCSRLATGISQENPDLWKWLSGQEEPPEELKVNPVFMAVWKKVATNLDNHAAVETRATPGQSWVRGWDDFKKGRDSPIVGNQ